jgi:uncharacterized DUF497 family protein
MWNTNGTKPKRQRISRSTVFSFTAAARALEDDPRKIEILDDRFDYNEERIQSLCMDRGKVLFVVTVMAEENVCRIITARKATRHEQEQYFEGGPLLS